MLDLTSWSKSAVVAFFSVSAALGADPQSFASQPAEEPVGTSTIEQLAYEPAAEVNYCEDPSFTSAPINNEKVRDEDPSWKVTLKEDYELGDMAKCESGWNPEVVNHGDSEITGHPSYGLFQFQPATFAGYIRGYGLLPDVPDEKLQDYIFDPDIQLELVQLMLADGEGHHWINCYYNKYGTGAHRATGVRAD